LSWEHPLDLQTCQVLRTTSVCAAISPNRQETSEKVRNWRES
jgi:hypothetical protein